MDKGTALITGASSGIGEALAQKFAAEGYDLVITARREDKLQQLAQSLSADVDVKIVVCDLGAIDGAESLIAGVEELGVTIDILVNNAGVAHTGLVQEMDDATVDNMILLNMKSLTTLTRYFATAMVSKGAGRILNVSSVAAFQPVPSMTIYAATKAYVLSLTEGISEELKGKGVYITALCPGLTKTEMVDDLPASNVPPMAMSSAKDVAREGFEALMNREVIRIPGMLNQAAVTWAQFQPRWLVRNLGGMFAKFNPNT